MTSSAANKGLLKVITRYGSLKKEIEGLDQKLTDMEIMAEFQS